MKLSCVRGRQQEYEDETGRRYWSVSEVLTVLDPDTFKGIDPWILAAAQDRGCDLHVLFALRLLSMGGIGASPKRPDCVIGQYYDGIDKFVSERKPRPLAVEWRACNDALNLAGTLDTRCLLDEEEWIIDLKSGPERAVHAAQLHAYKKLLGNEKAKRMGSLYIRKNGTYHLEEHTHDHLAWAWFLGALTVLNGRRAKGVR